MARAMTPEGPERPARPRAPRAMEDIGARLAEEMSRTSEALARHPADGWVFADPYPMSRDLVGAFHGLIRAVIPSAPAVPDVEVRIEQQVRRMMPYMQPLVAFGFTLVLRALDLAPLWRGRAPRRLRDMTPAAASALLEELERSRIGPVSDMVVAARAAILAPYYDLDEVCAHIDYQPLSFMRDRIALRRRLVGGGAVRPSDLIGPYSEQVATLVRDVPEEPEGAQ
ncbi:MAG: hypothetical protein EP329_21840 [Deltaproteobacteria bacterium]|nr:MAG: hypothetical protein EP329_21840 [Deltaproteobacteria bacterium]